MTENEPAARTHSRDCEQDQSAISVPEHRADFARVDQILEEQPVRTSVVLDQKLRCGEFQKDDRDEAGGQPETCDAHPRPHAPECDEQGQQHHERRQTQPDRHQIVSYALHQHMDQRVRDVDPLPLPADQCNSRQAESDQRQERKGDQG